MRDQRPYEPFGLPAPEVEQPLVPPDDGPPEEAAYGFVVERRPATG